MSSCRSVWAWQRGRVARQGVGQWERLDFPALPRRGEDLPTLHGYIQCLLSSISPAAPSIQASGHGLPRTGLLLQGQSPHPSPTPNCPPAWGYRFIIPSAQEWPQRTRPVVCTTDPQAAKPQGLQLRHPQGRHKHLGLGPPAWLEP